MKKSVQIKLLQIVQDNYREIAAQFDATRKKYIWPELSRVLGGLEDGDSILDVGCGNGRLLENLKNKKLFYLGVDSSKELIELAKINYPGSDFKVADILELNKTISKKFNLVISVAVLHHLPSQKLRLQALEQLKFLAAPHGQIIFSVWRLWDNKKYRRYLFKNIWQKIIFKSGLDFGDLLFPWKNNQGEAISERYYHAFTKSGLRRLLKAAKFRHYKLYSDQHNYWVVIDTP
ncbi:MAG: class I SAM-dependent methyltransferase [Candidatus Falkowbacteria bacterium]